MQEYLIVYVLHAPTPFQISRYATEFDIEVNFYALLKINRMSSC